MWQDIKPTLKNCLQSFTGVWFICLIITMLSVSIPWEKVKVTHRVMSYFVSDSLVNWRLNYLKEIMRISGANEKLYKLVAVTTDFYCAHFSKVVTGVVIYESMPMIQDLLGNAYPEVEPEWVDAIKKSVSSSSLGDLLDLNSEPPALEEVRDGASSFSAGSTDSADFYLGSSSGASAAGGRGSELSAINFRYQQQFQQQQGRGGVEGGGGGKDWHVFDPVFGVIEAKTLEKWKKDEQEAIAKATSTAPERRQRVLPPVRGTSSPLSTPCSSPMTFKTRGGRTANGGNGGGRVDKERARRGNLGHGSPSGSAVDGEGLTDDRDSFDSLSAPPSF